MELKYYLRGLGLGIVVTALIMGFALSGKQPMTDEEVIARAKQLGMIEDTVLAQKDSDKETEEVTEKAALEESALEEPLEQEDSLEQTETTQVIISEQPKTEEEDISRVEEIQAEADKVGQPEAKVEEEISTEPIKENEKIPTEPVKDNADEEELITSGATMTITIGSGDGSYTVSKKLADVGAVSSAETYDQFLCQNGYDKKIRTGTYVIPADASDEQMARIITGAE